MRALLVGALLAVAPLSGCVQPQPQSGSQAPTPQPPRPQASPQTRAPATPSSQAPPRAPNAPAATTPNPVTADAGKAPPGAPAAAPKGNASAEESHQAPTQADRAKGGVASPPAAAPTPAQPSAAPPTPAQPPSAPTLDLADLTQRLRDTSAIGVFTKLSLKNQVDDLLDQFRGFYQGQIQVPLSELRQRYELLLLKVVSLLQDGDPTLAKEINSSREAIWKVLANPREFSKI